MKVLVTGHDGYVGGVLVPRLLAAGHQVSGLDSCLFRGCAPLGEDPVAIDEEVVDIRDATGDAFDGIDAVVHLAAISNDPVGDLDPACTASINVDGTAHVAMLAKQAGVERFVFASSCSLYGSSGEDLLDEQAPFRPVTPYGESKVDGEAVLQRLADDDFSPTFLRFATAYGASPRLRGDLVVNNLVGYAVTTGQVLLKSDGSPLRPLVHVDDMSSAIIAALGAPREAVHAEPFNIVPPGENYRIREVAELVESLVPGSELTVSANAGPDIRNYRANSDKSVDVLDVEYRWDVPAGIVQLRDAFEADSLHVDDLTGSRFQRIAHLRELAEGSRIDDDMRWVRHG